MEPVDVFTGNLADIAAYGLLSVALLVIGFAGLELVTLGSLRRRIWSEGHRGAAVLATSFLIGLGAALTACISSSVMQDELWRGVLYAFIYGLVTIALMMFSFVLVDVLTPGPLGSILLKDEDGTNRIAPAVWVSAAFFIVIGFCVAAAL